MKRSKFSLSHYRLFSAMQGPLIPCGLIEVLPGDTIQQSTSCFIRVMPLQSPVMHPVEATIHHWFVPNRLVWENWEPFITGGEDGLDDSVFPIINTPATTGFTVGSLADYFGVTPGVASRPVSALPFRAYNLIFNEWYRDQDLQTPLAMSTADGTDTTTSTALVNRAWEKDYFTSSRPWEQKGPSVTIPLTGNAPVIPSGPTDPIRLKVMAGGPDFPDNRLNWNVNLNPTSVAGVNVNSKVGVATPSGMMADLSNVTAATIADLRLAMALQRYEENRARYGSRYVEYLRSSFGVRSSDARMQRPEYLGGGKQHVQFSEVLQTAPTTDGDDQDGVGNLKGHGIGALRSNRYRRFFEEHGYVISLLSVKPRTMYVQGLNRTFNRRTKEDFFQNELQHIGQQEVLNKEVYFAHTTPDGVFGYQDRYDEYRRMESGIAGEFRTTLDYWHMARIFASDPALNASFISSNPTNRVYALTDDTTHKLYVMARHSIQARRSLAKVGRSFSF